MQSDMKMSVNRRSEIRRNVTDELRSEHRESEGPISRFSIISPSRKMTTMDCKNYVPRIVCQLCAKNCVPRIVKGVSLSNVNNRELGQCARAE